MELKSILADDDAVSPVIGVILMVAITVILAAVIATFVLGLGDSLSDSAPQASFSFDWDGSSGGEAPLTIKHSGGGTVQAGNLHVRGQDGTVGGTAADLGKTWDFYSSGVGSPSSEVSAGSRATVDNIDADAEVDVVWESTEGEDSATLSNWEGPDA